jgi:glycosyltransferase involved in cell wall biosynthesis
MRIILTCNFSPWSSYGGGGQRSTHGLATALAERGHEVDVVFTRPPWERVRPPGGLPFRVHWASLWARRSASGAILRPLTTLTVARAVQRLLRRDAAVVGAGGKGGSLRRAGSEEATVVHANGEEGALVPRLRRAYRSHRFAFVVTPRYPSFPEAMHDGTWRRSPKRLGLLIRSSRYVILSSALRNADAWCPTSQASAESLQRVYGLEPEHCHVIPNGVAGEFLSVRRDSRAVAGPLVFFGRMVREKGLHTLVEALGLLGASAPECCFVGSGPLKDIVGNRLRQLGLVERVRFEPWLDPSSLAALLSRAALAVLPSTEESFGNAVAEAMAAGVPLVTTRVGSIPELVGDGRNALLVPPEDPPALADAITALIRAPETAERMAVEGRKRVREEFTWDRVASRYEQLYADLVP